jgi:hypothetical protein
MVLCQGRRNLRPGRPTRHDARSAGPGGLGRIPGGEYSRRGDPDAFAITLRKIPTD